MTNMHFDSATPHAKCNNNNNHNRNANVNVYGVVIMARAIARVHLVHVINADSALDACQPSDRDN